MESIGIISLYGLIFGMIGTTTGGFIGAFLNIKSNKFLGFILEFAAGLMTAVICFDLIPESLEIINISICIFGIFIGIFSMIFCDKIVSNYLNEHSKTRNNLSSEKNIMLKAGIIIAIGLAVHNFPEGLAIGSGFEASIKLGLALAIAICLHDIPEGISMAVPMKNGGMKMSKVLFFVILSGVTTGIGAFFGAIVGSISEEVIAICLSFAAGAMLYIVSGELIPESNQLYHGRMTAIR